MIALLLLLLGAAHAQDDARQQAAESSFDAVMQDNQVQGELSNLGYVESPPARNARAPAATTVLPEPVPPAVAPTAEVTVPLDRFEHLRETLAAAQAQAARSYATLVVLGASTYTGRATAGGLALHVQLQTTLRGAGFWKTVPLVGEEVAVVNARVGGAPIALANRNGYQVWVTDAVGEITLDLDVLVPARGPRGSLEYDFLVPRTPVTRFDCLFTEPGLEPRLQRTVRAETSAEDGGTHLAAWLEPTSRIHLVGFKDLGADDGRAARVYVETLSLLSVEEASADLFSVLRYSILQAGTRRFDIVVPTGLSVVSAEGAGGFHYALEPGADGTILHGETAFPIRDTYEVSLRLSHPLGGAAGASETLDVVPPHALGVEREHGWLGVEVLGTIQVNEVGRTEALSVDVAQLPAELVGNAVSPVLAGWRYHTSGASVRLGATRLPEREPAAGSIDEVVATTTIAAEGRARTELRLTLRNRLRHSLRLRLPAGVEVRGCQLNGDPVTPSRAADGAIILPLLRSAGERPEPFRLDVSLEGDIGALGLLGLPRLELPAIELPVSTLRWEVHAPAANRYTRLYGDIAPQDDVGATPGGGAAGESVLRYTRYWIGADQAARVRFGHLRGWVNAPLWLLGGVGILGGVLAGRRRWAPWASLPWARQRWAELRGAEATPAPGSWRARAWPGRVGMLAGTLIVGLPLLVVVLRLLEVATNPL